MLRLVIIIVLVFVLCRWALGKWPWEFLRPPQTRAQAVFRARKLLNVEHDATREQILAAHKRLVAMVHPDKGGTSAQVHEANDARDLLLDELPNPGVDLPDRHG
jgi:hypothetical protein